MTDINDLAARNVRRFRQERQFSIGELSRRSGLSKQTLSKVELGTGNPTVETLDAIATALGLTVRRLLTEWGSSVLVLPSTEGEWREAGARSSRLLDEIYGSGFVRTSLLRLDRVSDGRVMVSEGHKQGTLHHCYIVTGKVRVGPVGELVVLSQGDFVRFPADGEHSYEPLSPHALIHMVTTLPGVPQFGPARSAGQG